jgi:hypothetical protein
MKKTNKNYLYIAVVYAVMLFGAAYWYCTTDSDLIYTMENAEIENFKQSSIAISESNEDVLRRLDEAVKANPKFGEWKMKAEKIKQTAIHSTQILKDLEMKSTTNSLSQKDKQTALEAYKMLYDVSESIIEKREWKEYFAEKIFPIRKLTDLEGINTVLYLQAFQNLIAITTSQNLNYCLDKGTGHSCGSYDDPFRLVYQLEHTCVKAGEPIKGWIGLAKYSNLKISNLYVNGKPYPTVKGIALYKHPPQPAGKYPLVASCEVVVGDTTIAVRDTLYYMVR